eukprot:m.338646 g.338646  ORF g.338646 m.338646 type:complete len:328 (-) comp27803_c0_seq3:435-1418(-)
MAGYDRLNRLNRPKPSSNPDGRYATRLPVKSSVMSPMFPPNDDRIVCRPVWLTLLSTRVSAQTPPTYPSNTRPADAILLFDRSNDRLCRMYGSELKTRSGKVSTLLLLRSRARARPGNSRTKFGSNVVMLLLATYSQTRGANGSSGGDGSPCQIELLSTRRRVRFRLIERRDPVKFWKSPVGRSSTSVSFNATVKVGAACPPWPNANTPGSSTRMEFPERSTLRNRHGAPANVFTSSVVIELLPSSMRIVLREVLAVPNKSGGSCDTLLLRMTTQIQHAVKVVDWQYVASNAGGIVWIALPLKRSPSRGRESPVRLTPEMRLSSREM